MVPAFSKILMKRFKAKWTVLGEKRTNYRGLAQIGADTAGQELLRKTALASAKLASGQIRALSNIRPAAGKAPAPGK
jgi:hypothetical protein